jgi:tetratricopeptide (TPR) repeat protein
MGDTPFSRFCRSVISNSRVSKNSEKISAKFRKLPGDAARYKLFSELEPVRGYVHPITRQDKSQEKSDKAREQGNEFFKKRKFRLGIEAYNRCLKFAPPGVTMALGYANRSALLLDFGRRQEALEDVDRSFECGYPETLAYKLHLRKAKILHDQGRVMEAREQVVLGREFLPNDASTANWAQKFDEIEAGLAAMELEDVVETTKALKSSAAVKLEKVLGEYPLKRGQHPVFPSASSVVELRYTAESGRAFVAKEDINPG